MNALIDSCFVCRRLLWRDRGICSSCFKEFRKWPIQWREERGLEFFSVFNYVPPASVFIKLCKQPELAGLTRALAKIAAEKISLELLRTVDFVVPMPAREFGARDHAYTIAETVAEHLKVPLCPRLLQRKAGDNGQNDKQQKEKAQKERFAARIELSPEFTPLAGNNFCLLIDDVVTTGATLLQAWTALGRPAAIALTLAATPLHKQSIIDSCAGVDAHAEFSSHFEPIARESEPREKIAGK